MSETAAASKESTNGPSWFIRRGKQIRGPISSARIRHYVLEGRLMMDDEVSQDKKTWKHVSMVDEVVPLQFRHDNSVDEIDRVAQSKKHKHKAVVTSILALVVIVAVIGYVLWQQSERTQQISQCDVVAGPGVNWVNCKLDGRSFAGADLSGAQLNNASMVNANLSEANLNNANMAYVSLSAGNLAYADLRQANLKGASLRGADLTNTDFSRANLSFADLTGAKVGGLVLAGTNMQDTIWVDGKTCQDVKCRSRK